MFGLQVLLFSCAMCASGVSYDGNAFRFDRKKGNRSLLFSLSWCQMLANFCARAGAVMLRRNRTGEAPCQRHIKRVRPISSQVAREPYASLCHVRFTLSIYGVALACQCGINVRCECQDHISRRPHQSFQAFSTRCALLLLPSEGARAAIAVRASTLSTCDPLERVSGPRP